MIRSAIAIPTCPCRYVRPTAMSAHASIVWGNHMCIVVNRQQQMLYHQGKVADDYHVYIPNRNMDKPIRIAPSTNESLNYYKRMRQSNVIKVQSLLLLSNGNTNLQNPWNRQSNNLECTLQHHHHQQQHSSTQFLLPAMFQHKPVSVRWFSSSNNNNEVNDQNKTDTPPMPDTTPATDLQQDKRSFKSDTSTTAAMPSENAVSSTKSNHPIGVSEAVAAATQELEQRIKRVVRGEHLTIGDQLSVALIAIFTTILLAAPYAVQHMKQRANTEYGYEDRLQTDDPVDEFAKLARREWNMMDRNIDEDETKSGNEEKNQKFIEVLLKDVLQSTTVQHAAQEFVIQIIQSERFQSTIQHFVKELWNDLVTDPETVAQVIKLLEVAITSAPIKNAVIELVLQIAVRETEFRDAMIQMIQNLGMDNDVRNAVVQLLTESAHTTLNDPDIFDHSMEFATDVVGDDIVQQTAGEALRKSVEHAVKPATTIILSACGVGLLIFSFIALGYSRSSETEARIFASAARSLQSNAAIGVSRIVKWPIRTLPNILFRTFATMYNWLVSPFVVNVPDWRTPLHQASTRLCDFLCSLTIQTLTYSWRGIQTTGIWLSSTSVTLMQKTISSIYKYAAIVTSSVGVWMGATAMTVITIMESGIRTISLQAWMHTVHGLKYFGHGCWTVMIHSGSYIRQRLTNLIAALYNNMKSYNE